MKGVLILIRVNNGAYMCLTHIFILVLPFCFLYSTNGFTTYIQSFQLMTYMASVVMQRISYPTETVLYNKITRNRIVPSIKDSPRKPLRRRPSIVSQLFLDRCLQTHETFSRNSCSSNRRLTDRERVGA